MKSKILELHDQILKNNRNLKLILEASRKDAKKNESLNAIITSTYDVAEKILAQLPNQNISSNLLFGIPYSLKDNISTQDIITTGGSLFLKNYKPSFNATIYELLNSSKALLTSKSNLDEFGLGGTGIFSAYGDVKNNFNLLCSPGGSSSGSSVLVSSGVVSFAIGTDTGDSIRRPASFTNIVGYKPTYGLISRYGVLPYAPSLDHVGVFATTVADALIVAQELIKFDEKDFSSQNKPNLINLNKLQTLEKIKFVVIKNLINLLPKQQSEEFDQLLKTLAKYGHEIKLIDVDLNLFNQIDVTYQVISYCEAYSCYSNMTGILFGESVASSEDDYETTIYKNRTALFGDELKRRFTIGAYLTQKENYYDVYLKAKKVRTLLNNELINILKSGDCLLMPATANTASKISDLKNNINNFSLIDNTLILSNFAGTPSITIPFAFIDKMPWGINVTCNVFEDQKMFNIAYTLEDIVDQINGGKNE